MSELADLKAKYKSVLQLIQSDLKEYDYKRKGDTFIRCNNELTQKLVFQFEKIRNRNIGSLRLYVSLEHPEIDKLKSELFDGKYKYKTNIFYLDINFLQGENVFRSFNFNLETDGKLLSELIIYCLLKNIFPLYQEHYSNALGVMKAFEENRTEIRNHFCSNQGNDEYYLTWALIALCNNYLDEAKSILKFFNSSCKEEQKKNIIAEHFNRIVDLKEQDKSVYLELSTGKIYVSPNMKLIEKQILQFDGIRVYFMLLHNSISGDYLQVAGGPSEFVLEVRMHGVNECKHYRAEKNLDSHEEKSVLLGTGLMQTPLKQILSFQQILEIVEIYLKNEQLNSNYSWFDMSSYFGL